MNDYNFPKNPKKWNNEDYFQHYLQTKRFGYGFVKSFDKKQYNDVKQRLSELKELYFFIYNKLPTELKHEFYTNFNQQLKALIKKQFFDVNKNLFKDLKREIKIPQQENEKINEVKTELHNNIFKGNAFEIWQSMFERFKITKSQYSTDIDFMFEVMKYNNLIHENIRLIDMKKWINKVHEISFEKIRYTNPKSSANEKRLIIYNEIKSK